jgi:hypothetical protein
MTAQNRGLTGEQISALEMLAGCPDGCPEAVLKASGFTIGLLGKLIRAGRSALCFTKLADSSSHVAGKD